MYLNSIIFSIKNQDFESSTEFMDEFYIDKMAIIQSVISTQCTKNADQRSCSSLLKYNIFKEVQDESLIFRHLAVGFFKLLLCFFS